MTHTRTLKRRLPLSLGLCALMSSAAMAQDQQVQQQEPVPQMQQRVEARPLPAQGPEIERRLHPHVVEASSFLWNSWNEFQENYHPNYAFDGDKRTAWVEGADDNGKGQWLRAHVTPMQNATKVRLRLRNGYQKSKGLYGANSRPKTVTVTLYPSGHSEQVTLEDTQGWQEIAIAQPSGKLNAVELKIDKVYAGKKYTDTCISDVELFATATTRENPAAERAHLKRIKTWKKARIKAARLFKKGKKGHVPLAQRYTLTKVDGLRISDPQEQGCEWSQTQCRMVKIVESLKANGKDVPAALIDEALTALTHLPGQAKADGSWRLSQVAPRDKRPLPKLDHLAQTELWEAFDGGNFYIDRKGQVHGHFPLPLNGRVGDLTADGLAVFDLKGKVTLDKKGWLAKDTCRGNRDGVSKTYNWARMSPKAAGEKSRVNSIFTVQCGGVETRGGAERVESQQLLVYNAAGHLSLVITPIEAVHYTWRTEGDQPILSGGLRLGAYNEAVRLAEAPEVAAR
ncbi:MAG: NADase-type glycan-binding domain-containing protein [Bradymonadia bacterium]